MVRQDLLFQNTESENLSSKEDSLSWQDLRGLSWVFCDDFDLNDESFKAKVSCA